MSTPMFKITLLLLLLLSTTPSMTLAGRNSLFKVAPPATRSTRPNSHGFATLKPQWTKNKRHAFRGREIGNCLPKGFRPPPSAPSRYANYNTLGAGSCSPVLPNAKP